MEQKIDKYYIQEHPGCKVPRGVYGLRIATKDDFDSDKETIDEFFSVRYKNWRVYYLDGNSHQQYYSDTKKFMKDGSCSSATLYVKDSDIKGI